MRPKPEHLDAIRVAGEALAAAERALFVAVARARQDLWRFHGYRDDPGVTWEDVGDALGITKQAAAKRFGGWRYDEPTDQLIREKAML